MRVLIVSQYFWPENFRINELSQELTQRGHVVTILTGVPNYPTGKIFDVFEQNRRAFDNYFGITVCRVPMVARGCGAARLIINYLSFVIGASIFGPLKLRGRRFDVIFVFEPSPVTVGLPAILIGRLKSAPIVFWVQDLWPETLSAIGVVRSPQLLAAIGVLVRFIYNRCALVLGQSHGFLKNISLYCNSPSKIRYFPNWAEDGQFFSSDVVAAPEISVVDDVFTVLFAGNVGEAQDFPAVLEAAEMLKGNLSIRWVIVGDGRMSEWLNIEVLRRGLSHCFLLLGRFPLERMPSFFVHADALLVSLKRDPVFALTIPSKVQSYLMAGVPILGMLDGEGAEIIREANAGFACSSGDSAGLAEAVLAMYSLSKNERQQLGERGRAYAQKEFSRDKLVDNLEGWFDEVAHQNKQPTGEVNF